MLRSLQIFIIHVYYVGSYSTLLFNNLDEKVN